MRLCWDQEKGKFIKCGVAIRLSVNGYEKVTTTAIFPNCYKFTNKI